MSHTRAELEAMAAVGRNAKNSELIAQVLGRIADSLESIDANLGKIAGTLAEIERHDRPGQPLYRPPSS